MDENTAWVGSNVDGASLRVDVGSEDKIYIANGMVCSKEYNPCYFIEVENAQSLYAEQCVYIDTLHQQCNEEVTPFKGKFLFVY